MLDLFGNETPEPSVTVNSGDGELKEAWKLWCELTQRPRQYTPEKNFSKGYRAARMDRMPYSAVLDRITAASFLPPRPRDPADTRRVIMTLRRKDLFQQGKRLMASGADPIMYGAEEDFTTLSTVADVVDACGVSSDLWSLDEHAASDALIRKYTPGQLVYGADVARNEFGLPDVLPSHMVLTERQWNGGEEVKVKLNANRSVNDRGRAEAEEIPAEILSLDVRARKMYFSGHTAEEVIAFHNRAPDGFWDMVKSLVNSGESISESVLRAELKFGWSC